LSSIRILFSFTFLWTQLTELKFDWWALFLMIIWYRYESDKWFRWFYNIDIWFKWFYNIDIWLEFYNIDIWLEFYNIDKDII
jgi:hypothetical protein